MMQLIMILRMRAEIINKRRGSMRSETSYDVRTLNLFFVDFFISYTVSPMKACTAYDKEKSFLFAKIVA